MADSRSISINPSEPPSAASSSTNILNVFLAAAVYLMLTDFWWDVECSLNIPAALIRLFAKGGR
jgi:hypothetical protein